MNLARPSLPVALAGAAAVLAAGALAVSITMAVRQPDPTASFYSQLGAVPELSAAVACDRSAGQHRAAHARRHLAFGAAARVRAFPPKPRVRAWSRLRGPCGRLAKSRSCGGLLGIGPWRDVGQLRLHQYPGGAGHLARMGD